MAIKSKPTGHLAAAAAFLLGSLLWTFPLATRLATHLPGDHAGDNVTFLWDLGWMREAVASADAEFFFTKALFHPVGLDLTLHTHTAFHALIGATLLGGLPLPVAQNLLILASLWLNALSAYALAWHVTRSHSAAALAGLIFGGSPYVSSHLLGHFNLVAAYGIPLVALATLRTLERASLAAALATGLLLTMTAYTDYYHALFAALLWALLYGLQLLSPSFAWRDAGPRTRAARKALLGLIVLLALLALVVEGTGGFAFPLAGRLVSVRGSFNLRTIAGLLGLILLATHVRPRLEARRPIDAKVVRLALGTALVFGLGIAPLVWRGLRLWQQGQYVSQAYVWRNAPPGLDLAALALPHARHPFVGEAVARLYTGLGLDRVETTPVGLVPAVLVFLAWRSRRQLPAQSARWWLIGAVFLVWSLGPYLRVAGFNTGLLSPQAALRYVPIVANARIPGRAVVVVLLAAALLIAARVAAEADPRRRRRLALGAGVLVALEYLPAPFPTFELPQRAIDAWLARAPGGAVLEVPLGIQDAFGTRGCLDPAIIYGQTVHGHPILGGAASRVPRSVDAAYAALPVIGTLVKLGCGEALEPAPGEPDQLRAAETFARLGIRFVVIDTSLAGPGVGAYLATALPLTLVMREGPRELYAVDAPVLPFH